MNEAELAVNFCVIAGWSHGHHVRWLLLFSSCSGPRGQRTVMIESTQGYVNLAEAP